MTPRNPFILIVLLLTLSACGRLLGTDITAAAHAAGPVEPGAGRGSGVVMKELYSQYEEWRGVEHRMGGLSKSGIDCSGFVHMTFKSKFGLELPRSTELLSGLGEPVRRSSLMAGDLVFFKTGLKVRHVGIYLEKGRFLHASKTRGVMISRLSYRYWKERYWMARRVGALTAGS